MIIIPAIDLKDGKCVRLKQGLADQSTVYSENPADMAKRWEDAGGEFLHVVDLDGAFTGKRHHTDIVKSIVDAVDMPVEIGGGIRTDEDIRITLDCGVARVIIGTRAINDIDALGKLVSEFGDKIVVGIDARDGFVQVNGWVETSTVRALDLATIVADVGVATIIYTDTATDGMLRGHNVVATEEMCKHVSCNIVASGGVSSVEDVKRLSALECSNLEGAIVGKALYDSVVTLEELIKAV
ncbi:MAG: 1-(5-phosphoribosyl)-5-[(5-phosphoribosylamino)methylideneamino]imidazole-4-carboxamide isomerase [Kiritimatiellae bacterium]|nr:1-(5-phosphoribosyl)-5-[(5-phosphoribosylamino)methylideneamino]imidazole-4-carboxamide isomerase [Kiritimatiellia bacterium]